MKPYWLSCTKFTVSVTCDNDDNIILAAPIVRKFIGQPLDNLTAWMKKIGGFEMHTITYTD